MELASILTVAVDDRDPVFGSSASGRAKFVIATMRGRPSFVGSVMGGEIDCRVTTSTTDCTNPTMLQSMAGWTLENNGVDDLRRDYVVCFMGRHVADRV